MPPFHLFIMIYLDKSGESIHMQKITTIESIPSKHCCPVYRNRMYLRGNPQLYGTFQLSVFLLFLVIFLNRCYLENESSINAVISSPYGIPSFSHNFEYILIEVNPGNVLISLKINVPSSCKKKSTRDKP